MTTRSRRLLRTTLGPKFSEGARRLWMALHRRRCSQTELAVSLGASSALFSRWLWGDRRPELAWAEKIERELRIAMSAWVEAPRKAFAPPDRIAAGRRTRQPVEETEDDRDEDILQPKVIDGGVS
jgi:hypothetical protein